MLKMTRRAALLGAASFLAACVQRGQIHMFEPTNEADMVPVMVATNRARTEGEAIYSGQRASGMNYSEITVSVPPAHETGRIELAFSRADPNKHFGVTNIRHFDRASEFSTHVGRRARALPAQDREAVVFVHGFNTQFPEALYRLGQMMHDFGATAVPVLFSWPSGGDPSEYLYDRDSVLFARDALETLLDQLESSDIRRIQLIGHSMGSQLIVEALRQKAIRSGGQLWSKLDGVVLASPDIDIDVFAQQASEIGTLPQPFVIMTSDRDRALLLSEWISSSRARLGSVSDQSQLAALAITLVDTSQHGDTLSTNHFTGLNSPAMIAFLKGLRNSRISQSTLPPGVQLPASLWNGDYPF